MNKIIAFLTLIALCGTGSWAKDNFGLIDTWKHEFEALGRPVHSQVDGDGHLLVSFQLTGNRLVTPTKVVKCIPWGQGPDELTNCMSIFPYGPDMAILEMVGKVKIFTKKNGTYVCKDTQWQKRSKFFHIITRSLYYDDKWFFAGYECFDAKDPNRVYYLKVYNHKGKLLKQLFEDRFDEPNRYYHLIRYVAPHRDRVLYLAENALQVRPVSLKNLAEEKTVNLKRPPFYKEMPPDFHILKKYSNAAKELPRDLQKWSTSYSRITYAAVDGDYLVLQIRTCSAKLKKFALLFYRLDNFKLEKTFFLDDALLGAGQGKFYCFANGVPALDEEAEDFTINVYGFLKN